MPTADDMKKAAAEAALDYINSGDIVGVGTGSTANHFIDFLGQIKGRIEGAVASSEASAKRLKGANIIFDTVTVTGTENIMMAATLAEGETVIETVEVVVTKEVEVVKEPEPEEVEELPLRGKVAVVSQTTKKPEDFAKIVSALMLTRKEVRVFNTICNATFENQDAAAELAKDADVMIVIGGRHSSNTKQLHSICKSYCEESYLIENEKELESSWFEGKKLCGISAGASTPDWVVQNVIDKIQSIK